MKHDWRDLAGGFLAGFWWTIALLAGFGLLWLFARDMLAVFT